MAERRIGSPDTGNLPKPQAARNGAVEKPSSHGIGQHRHSGECRNPEPRRMATLRFFIPHSLAGMQKKQRQSPWIPACAGMTIKSEEQNHPPALGGAFGASLPRRIFSTTLLTGGQRPCPTSRWWKKSPPDKGGCSLDKDFFNEPQAGEPFHRRIPVEKSIPCLKEGFFNNLATPSYPARRTRARTVRRALFRPSFPEITKSSSFPRPYLAV